MESHLLQMRGLKRLYEERLNLVNKSHLLQMRGLKPSRHRLCCTRQGRIFYRCVD